VSTDFQVVCDTCKLIAHLGQRMGGRTSFGYGSNDAIGRKIAAEFITTHHEHGEGPRIEVSDTDKRRKSDGYIHEDTSSPDIADDPRWGQAEDEPSSGPL
jgi:hypothetical protein